MERLRVCHCWYEPSHAVIYFYAVIKNAAACFFCIATLRVSQKAPPIGTASVATGRLRGTNRAERLTASLAIVCSA